MQIEAGQFYIAQDGASVVCAITPAVEVLVRALPEALRIAGQMVGLPFPPPEVAQKYRDDWGIVVVVGGHGDPRYRGASTKPEGGKPILTGPGIRSRIMEEGLEKVGEEGLEKVMGLYPAKRISVRWEEASKSLEDVEAGDFVRTANGSICVSGMAAATDEDLNTHNGDGVGQLGDFGAIVICGGTGLAHYDPEGTPGTQISLNVDGDLAGRYRKMAESADDAATVGYIRAIKEDMRPVCIVRPVVTDPETN